MMASLQPGNRHMSDMEIAELKQRVGQLEQALDRATGMAVAALAFVSVDGHRGEIGQGLVHEKIDTLAPRKLSKISEVQNPATQAKNYIAGIYESTSKQVAG
jgi:hypothetical protein